MKFALSLITILAAWAGQSHAGTAVTRNGRTPLVAPVGQGQNFKPATPTTFPTSRLELSNLPTTSSASALPIYSYPTLPQAQFQAPTTDNSAATAALVRGLTQSLGQAASGGTGGSGNYVTNLGGPTVAPVPASNSPSPVAAVAAPQPATPAATPLPTTASATPPPAASATVTPPTERTPASDNSNSPSAPPPAAKATAAVPPPANAAAAAPPPPAAPNPPPAPKKVVKAKPPPNCSGKFSDIKGIVSRALNMDLPENFEFHERATDGKPLRIDFAKDKKQDILNVTIRRYNGDTYGPFAANVCIEKGGSIQATLNGTISTFFKTVVNPALTITDLKNGNYAGSFTGLGPYVFCNSSEPNCPEDKPGVSQ